MIQLGFGLLAIGGHYANVGMVGDRVDVPLLPRVNREQTFHGSYWGTTRTWPKSWVWQPGA